MDTYQAIMRRSFLKFANEPFLGHRPKKADGSLEKKYVWETYKEVEKIAKCLGSGLINKELLVEKSQYKDYKIKPVAIYAHNTREWVLIDAAATLYGLTVVPIYDTLGQEAIEVMFEETETPTIFLTCKHIKSMVARCKEGAFPHLKTFIVMDEDNFTGDEKEILSGAEVSYFMMSEVIGAGKRELQEYADVKPEDISFFSYTSGTTGRPKGAIITQANIAAEVAGAHFFIPNFHMAHLSYLPLAHVFERIVYSMVIYRGGQYGMFNGDARKVKEDLQVLQPTIFVSVPRMYNKFHDVIQEGIRSATGIKGKIARRAIKTKTDNHKVDGSVTHFLYDKLVFKKMKAALGGRVKYCLTGSAPMSSSVREFLKIAFCCPFAEGYGQTEALGGEFVSH